MEVTQQKEGALFLHTEIGKGQMPDGRECRLIQTNAGIHMQVYTKGKNNGNWKTFSVPYMELSKAIVEEIKKIEEVSADSSPK